ncbi:DUF6503 family protein [Algoriphagus hitonicola]|uniref:Outer membrane lipoprotein-sorting protein n=1 Tax=Algoriphagus hitonicola TaxID=435880 RepID=A0A1I2RLS5_9BACT|nr:DUF6503 family protein [Algoriphagus hitonicola]SFG41043.1 hypothetical protein SAMN04487988_103295 [Algoriphagus hitonicola]
MRKLFLILVILSFSSCQFEERSVESATELVEKSIQFHDPNQMWGSFSGTFSIKDSLPNGRASRRYEVSFQNQLNKVHYRNDDLEFIVWEDSVQVFKGEIKKDRALMLRNYYSYLWGLPMKLMDPETKVEEEILVEDLDGKSYQVVRIPYEKDTWYFYFDPESAQLEAYKFYQDEVKQKGEIIFLEGLVEFEGLRIPKNRSWYRTEKEEFLGTDQLISIQSQNSN